MNMSRRYVFLSAALSWMFAAVENFSFYSDDVAAAGRTGPKPAHAWQFAHVNPLSECADLYPVLLAGAREIDQALGQFAGFVDDLIRPFRMNAVGWVLFSVPAVIMLAISAGDSPSSRACSTAARKASRLGSLP